ncbi:MAG: sulfatase [Phaeodactylibacter sp.]|uniref:sulfatase family protein n=1 Tax=Phaeodactylibacter sp. TaxID=1940289 RepID=UPI0032EB257F
MLRLRNLLVTAAAVLAVLCCGSLTYTSDDHRPPNLIVIFCDDLGYGDLRSYGHPTIATPHLDQMAREGMLFTQFYSASPACTASRYALLTGRYPVRSGFDWVLYPKSERGLHPKEHTLAEGLKTAGYRTGCFGKWHLGSTKPEYLPLQNGFDAYVGLPYSNDMIPPKWPDIALLSGNDTLGMNPDQSLLTGLYTQVALDFMQQDDAAPFFVYLPFAMPHVPLYPGEAFEGHSRAGTYGDVVEEIDDAVGQIRSALDQAGLAENTLILFTSDNGPWIIKGADGGSAGHLRDGKGSTWEGGMRVPGIACWPGTIAPGQVQRAPVNTMDCYTTLLQLAGQDLPEDRLVDGQNLLPLLRGDTLADRPFFYYGPGNQLQSVRKGPWKLHQITSSQTGIDYFDGQLPLLFNLDEDPGERFDRAVEYPEVVAELQLLLKAQAAATEKEGTYWD